MKKHNFDEFCRQNGIVFRPEEDRMRSILRATALHDLYYLWRNAKFLFYEPLPKQMAFHRSLHPIRVFSGGNMTGKTLAGAQELIWHVTGIYPPWYPEQGKLPQPIRARIVVTDFTKTGGQVVLEKLREWFPFWNDNTKLEKVKAHQTIYTEFKWLPNGSTFDIMSHGSDTQSYEGWKGHFVWADEPMPRDKFVPLMRGIGAKNGRFIMTQTPVAMSESVWIQRELYEKSNLGRNPDGKVFYIIMDITENPYLSREFIHDYETRMTDAEKDARLHGRAIHLASLVYPEIAYQPGIYVISPFNIPPHWTRYMAVDPHPRAPFAALYMAVAPDGTRYLYDEIYDHISAEDAVRDMARREASDLHGDTPPDIRIIDRAGCVPDQKDGASWQSLLMEAGQRAGFGGRFWFQPCIKYSGSVKSRIALCRSQLEVRMRPTLVDGKWVEAKRPNIYIFSHLANFLYSCENHVYLDYKGVKRETHAPSTREAGVWSHLPDCWGMIEMENPYYKRRVAQLKILKGTRIKREVYE